MATINVLMKHLRANGVQISGSNQKRDLRRIGYFHGYKGYRYVGTPSKRLPLTNFDEVVALHDFDMELKSLFYSPLMSVETALKNRVLEKVLEHSGSERFEDIYKTSLTAYRCVKRNQYSAAWSTRLRLRTDVDQLVIINHTKKPMIRYYIERDRDVPIWALFEIMSLGNFGTFYNCLHDEVKEAICVDLGMPYANFDCPAILGKMIFALKDLRNAIAHNSIILDARFKTAEVHKSVIQLLKSEMNLEDMYFKEVTDYVLFFIYLMSKLDFPKSECKRFLRTFEEIVEKY